MCRLVSRKESTHIERGKTSIAAKRDIVPVPYRAILTDIHAWAIIVSSLGGYFAFQLLLQYGPIYINKVLSH